MTDLSEESIDAMSEIVYYLKGKTLKKDVMCNNKFSENLSFRN